MKRKEVKKLFMQAIVMAALVAALFVYVLAVKGIEGFQTTPTEMMLALGCAGYGAWSTVASIKDFINKFEK